MVGSINYIKVKYMARNKDQINGITPIFRIIKEKGKKKKNRRHKLSVPGRKQWHQYRFHRYLKDNKEKLPMPSCPQIQIT